MRSWASTLSGCAALQLASSPAGGEGVEAAAAASTAKRGRALLTNVASLNSGNDFDGDLGQLAAVMAQRVSLALPAFEMLYLLSQIRASLGAAFLRRVLAALDAIAANADADGATRSAEETAVILLLRGRCVFVSRVALHVLRALVFARAHACAHPLIPLYSAPLLRPSLCLALYSTLRNMEQHDAAEPLLRAALDALQIDVKGNWTKSAETSTKAAWATSAVFYELALIAVQRGAVGSAKTFVKLAQSKCSKVPFESNLKFRFKALLEALQMPLDTGTSAPDIPDVSDLEE